MPEFSTHEHMALQNFRKARRRASLNSLLSSVTGKQDELLSWDQVSKNLGLVHPNKKYIENVPLDKIVGSVNRYLDFDRQFYPLLDDDQVRWTRVGQLVEERGLEPVEVYKVGGVYFVYDGNHRVSVARQNEAAQIEAYVTEFRSPVELLPDDTLRDVIMRVEREELFEDTKLDKISVDLDLAVSQPGCYPEVFEHISVHRYYLGLEHKREIPMLEAAESWAKNIYLPAIKLIRKMEVLKDFPDRTETDLYLWLKKHEWELAADLGAAIPTETAVRDLTNKFSRNMLRRFVRWRRRIRNMLK